jgi:large subunit ribosomal protein L22
MSSKVNKDEINMEAKASIKSIKTSTQKVNLILQTIRGLDVEKAINILEFSRKRIAGDVKKILKSAISNAENNHQLDIDRLFVKEATVGKSMVMKRFRPRARGRSGKILKPYSKIKIIVREKEQEKKPVKEQEKKPVKEIGVSS